MVSLAGLADLEGCLYQEKSKMTLLKRGYCAFIKPYNVHCPPVEDIQLKKKLFFLTLVFKKKIISAFVRSSKI